MTAQVMDESDGITGTSSTLGCADESIAAGGEESALAVALEVPC